MTQSLAKKPHWMFEYVELEKQNEFSDLIRYKRACNRCKIKKKPKKRLSKLAKWPPRVDQFVNCERDLIEEAIARYKNASDRTKIKCKNKLIIN